MPNDPLDLTSVERLREAATAVSAKRRGEANAKEWNGALAEFLEWLASLTEDKRAAPHVQERLWDNNPVSSVGQGNISVSRAIANESFRRWLAKQSIRTLPNEPEARAAGLTALYDEVLKKLEPFVERTPHLKTARVLAAIFPRDFTTIAHRWKLITLAQRMGGSSGMHPAAAHVFINQRLNEALGPAGGGWPDQAWRMQIPWYLYEMIEEEKPSDQKTAQPGPTAGQETLLPLPAARRRRGLTAINGGFQTVLSLLEFAKDGVTREELLDQILTAIPGTKESSRRTVINVLQSELAVLKREGELYKPTNEGLAALRSGDASELGNWLLTRILGVDHVLKSVSEKPRTRRDLLPLLQRANPGWTTTFAPNALVNWVVSLGAFQRQDDGSFVLTPMGKEWSARITWTPEFLVTDPGQSKMEDLVESSVEQLVISLPSVAEIIKRVNNGVAFPPSTIERLHIGLWPSRSGGNGKLAMRHFAVLTGISGSGKTQLAMQYGRALSNDKESDTRVLVQSVQPGWYDATPLLGYLNPLRDDAYTRTAVLEFVLRATQDPAHPYVLILDEMNLSHPEQYFAPFLSAMETGGKIVLHSEQGDYDGVPRSIDYPANLAIIGTVNMDETTHGLSDKVLDRAFTLEFWTIEIDKYPHWGRRKIPADQERKIREVLNDLMGALNPARLHFAWRVIDDVLNYMETAEEFSGKSSFLEHLDSVIYARILPKLRGEDSHKFRAALVETHAALMKHGLGSSATRVAELQKDLTETGSARFWR
jgi:5-methylcytosine-specific restriction enzyme B